MKRFLFIFCTILLVGYGTTVLGMEDDEGDFGIESMHAGYPEEADVASDAKATDEIKIIAEEKRHQELLQQAITQGDLLKLYELLLESWKIKLDQPLISALEYQLVDETISEEMVRALLDAKKEHVKAKNIHGVPALHLVLTFEKPSINNVVMLLEFGANKDEKAPSNDVLEKSAQFRDIQGKIPLEVVDAKLKVLMQEKSVLAKAVKSGLLGALVDIAKDLKAATVGGEKSARKKLKECTKKIEIFTKIQKLLSREEDIGLGQLLALFTKFQASLKKLSESLQALNVKESKTFEPKAAEVEEEKDVPIKHPSFKPKPNTKKPKTKKAVFDPKKKVLDTGAATATEEPKEKKVPKGLSEEDVEKQKAFGISENVLAGAKLKLKKPTKKGLKKPQAKDSLIVE